MPPEWAASGARLILPNLDVQFQEEIYKYGYSENWERLLGDKNDPGPFRMDVLSMPKFVGASGEEIVEVVSGAYTLRSFPNDDDRFPMIRVGFFLDFPNGAARNDVNLPAERIFFTSECWVVGGEDGEDDKNDENDGIVTGFKSMKKQLNEMEEELRKVNEKISEWDRIYGNDVENTDGLNETASRSGNLLNFIRKAKVFRNRVVLSDRKNILKRRLESLKKAMPDVKSDNVVCSPNGILFNRDGYLTVKRYGGLLGISEQYHIVGKFSISFLES